MIKHYFKVAFRNLWKYKKQTLISVVGLAVGFACFAMASLWIRYEMTYDSYHNKADRLFLINVRDRSAANTTNGLRHETAAPLAPYLKKTFPEIAGATKLVRQNIEVEIDDFKLKMDVLLTDSTFLEIFGIKVLEGNSDFLIPESRKIAVTQEKALQMFGKESPLGKIVKADGEDIIGEYTVGAIISGIKHSNYPFDMLSAYDPQLYMYGITLIELLPGIDAGLFGKKLHEHKAEISFVLQNPRNRAMRSGDKFNFENNIVIAPLQSIHYKDPNIPREIQFQYIVIFSVAGSLLILCTLFNYLTLFVSRFRIRQRELALRVVFGASNSSLFKLLSVEFFMALFIALLSGLFCIYLFVTPFRELSGIKLELSSIYFESSVYIAGIIVIALLTFILTLAAFRRRTLNVSIRSSNRKLFRRASIVVQLIISIGFAFCTAVILKQMYYLHNTPDLGFTFKNCGTLFMHQNADMEMLENKIRQIPEISETLRNYNPLLPVRGYKEYLPMNEWDDKPAEAEPIRIEYNHVPKAYFEYYGLELVAGEMLSDNDRKPEPLLINESAVKAFRWDNAKAIGKLVWGHKVKGVIKNTYHLSPIVPAKPALYIHENFLEPVFTGKDPAVMFKYSENTWKICRDKIDAIIKAEYPNTAFEIVSAEEEYDKYLKSENALLWLLSLISLVCVTVCVFGFISMVSLTCEERRREIAVRKIHGATVKDILDIFFREYLSLLAAGALIAFPAGYIIMKGWLEGYVIQTEISPWVYVSILLVLLMAIILCVGGKVLKTSRANPAEAVKS